MSAVPDYSDVEVEERQAARARLLEEMNPDLRKWLDNIENKLAAKSKDELQLYWNIGRDAAKIASDEKKYGEQAIERVAFCLGKDKEVIYKAMRFKAAFDQDDLTHLLSLKIKGSNRLLTWSHVVVTMMIENRDERRRLLERAAEENLNHTELDREVAKTLGKEERHAGGRKPNKPKTIDAMIHNIQLSFLPLRKKFEEVWNDDAHGFLAVVEQSDPKVYTPDMVKEINDLEATAEDLENKLTALRQNLLPAKKRIQHSLALKAKEDAESTTTKMTGKNKVNA